MNNTEGVKRADVLIKRRVAINARPRTSVESQNVCRSSPLAMQDWFYS